MKKIFRFTAPALFVLYVLSFVFTFSSSLPNYISSTFLAGLTSEQATGIIYVFCAIATIIVFVFMPQLFRKYGNYKLTLYLCILTFFALLGITFSKNAYVIILCFIVSYITTTLISLCLDVFIEHNSFNFDTGRIRSFYLTAINIAYLFSPWLSGLLIGTSSYWKVFLAATAVMIPTTLLVSYNLKGFKDPEYSNLKFLATVRDVRANKDIRSIFASSFLLNFFFAWMVIYTPLYLNKYIGFSWVTIGAMFTIMLVPFVFIQVPAGELADKKYGEKEMLSIGFVIMAISCALIPLVGGKSFLIWAILLCMTRIGAALVQVMSDTYFFKKIGEKNVDIITMYRLMSLVAYGVAPLVAIVFLWYFKIQYIFFALGFLMLFGLRYSVAIIDTK